MDGNVRRGKDEKRSDMMLVVLGGTACRTKVAGKLRESDVIFVLVKW